MANNNVPAHDFAPSWLKIPAYDSASKNAHTDGAYTPRREEHRLQRRTSAGRTHFGYSDGHRDWDGHSLGGGSRPFFISRHHSLDVEEGHHHHHHPGAPPPLHPPPHVDALIPPRRPHSRHDFRDLQPSYQKVNSGSRPGDGCSFPVLKNASTGIKPSTEGSRKNLTSNNFNQEFPTLQGNSEAPVRPSITNGSVWENPRNSKVHGTVLKKVHLFQRPLRNDTHNESRSKSPSSGVANPSLTSVGPVSPKLARHTNCQPLTGGTVFKTLTPAKKNQQSHTMEILVKHPKTKGNKGDFLKALKGADDSKEEDVTKGEGDAGENCTVNGERKRTESSGEDARSEEFDDSMDFSKLSLDNSVNTPLSSSLEAEQRLLREMGWKEEALDDDAYAPLTEDELREYQNLTKLRQEKQRNGTALRPQLWSPRRMVAPLTVVSTAAALLNDSGRWSSSSSDSSSDSDSN